MTEEVASLIIKADSTQIKSARDELDKLSRSSAGTEKSVSQLSRTVSSSFDSIKTGIASVVAGFASLEGIKSVANAALELEKINNSLQVGVGSVEAANQAWQFLRKTSEELGLDLRESALQFSRLSAAAKGTAIEGKVTRDIFLGISRAAASLGLSSDEAGGALLAIQQIISKGKVSLEELSGQLGERLPGALQISARAMGITVEEMNKLVSTGNLTADQLLPKLAAELDKTFGMQAQTAAQGLQSQINRFNTALFDMQIAIGKTGLIDFLTRAIELSARLTSSLASAINDTRSSAEKSVDVSTHQLKSLRELYELQRNKLGDDNPSVRELHRQLVAVNDRHVEILKLQNEQTRSVMDQVNANNELKSGIAGLTEEQKKRSKEITESVVSPIERFKEAQKELNDLLSAGGITQETYNRRLAKEKEILEKSSAAKAKHTSENERFLKSLVQEASQLGKTSAEIKRMEAAQLGILDAATPLIDRVDAYNRSLRDQEIRVDSITKNLQRYQSITESVLTDQEKYDRFVQQLNEAKNATDGTAISQETYNRALKKAEEQFLKTGDAGRRALDEISQFAIQAQRNLQNALGDALFDGIDGRFGDMVDGFTRALKQMLAQALAADIWGALFNKRTGNMAALFGSLGLTGNAAASGGSSIGGMLDIASLGSSAASMFSTGLGATNLLGGALSSIGGMFGSGSTAAFGAGFAGDLIGGVAAGVEAGMSGAAAASAASMGSTIGAVAGPAIALAAVDMIGRFLAGNKSTGTFVDSVPVIGGFAGALFGRGPLKQKETNLIGAATAEGFDGITSTKFKAEGGLFRSDKIKRVESELSLEFETLLDSAITGFSDSLRNIADTLGLSKDAIDNFSQSINIATEKGKDFTDEQIAELIADIGQNMSEQLLPAVGELRNAGETAFQTLQRLGSEFNVLTNLGAALGNSLADTRSFLRSVSFEQRSAFVEAAGGLDVLSANANFFAENFLSDAERLQPSIELLNEEMAKLGLSAEISKSQFRELVMSFGQTNGISEEMLQGLLGVQHLFVRVKDGLAALNPELRAAADATFDLAAAEELISDKRSALIAAYSREKSALENVAARFSDLAANLRNSSASLSLGNLSPLTPQQRLEEARRQFNLDRMAANAGDQEALRRLPESGRAFLEASQVFNASSAEFVSDFNLVKQVLDSAAITAETEADIAQRQLTELEATVSRLTDIDKGVDSVEQAIKELTDAVLQGVGNPSISDQAIRDFINTPGRSVQEIKDAAVKFGVSGSQIAKALNVDQSVINKAAGGQSVSDQAIKDFVSANINDPMAIYNAAIANGISSRRLAAVTGINIDDINNFVRMNGLAAFKEGTDFVPHDGLAMLHKGEAVTPSSLVTEVKALRLELAELRREQNQQTSALINVAIDSQKMNANMIIQNNQDVVKSAAWREQAKAVVR